MGNPCNALGRAWLARVCVEMALSGGKGKAGLEEAGLGETVPIVQVSDHDCTRAVMEARGWGQETKK